MENQDSHGGSAGYMVLQCSGSYNAKLDGISRMSPSGRRLWILSLLSVRLQQL